MKEVFTWIGYIATFISIVTAIIGLYKVWKIFYENRFTWRKVEKGVEKLVDKMKKDIYDPDIIVGIGRSGGIIGGLIAGCFGSKPFMAINRTFGYPQKTVASITDVIIDSEFLIGDKYKKILLVEGASTTGDTPKKAIELMQNKFPDKEFKFAVLVKKSSSTARIDYVAYNVNDNIKLAWHVKGWPWPINNDPLSHSKKA